MGLTDMKELHLCFVIFSVFAFVSCAEQKSVWIEPEQLTIVEPISDRQNEPSLPVDFSMLEIGRELSDGAVDIYDPWLTVFDVTPPARTVPDPLATFPVNRHIMTRDSNVRVYSLSADLLNLSSSFNTILNSVSDRPIQLVEQEPLLP